ncbi:unnamed protein product [Cyberlindnera jadinii]|uniref:SPT2-domain-containing protein n=1 Tax=Cyberlindnera jadinii (strain ATCC 18201 / CBS 1600 / BCRC 20928 / JCM 3617 / NBRC 0987 / NRRL Y-1542) TaxID=983966 RepID=A0A0H5C0Z1_CYBJN|nr:unnamed protein product [Cyberlindnera jadinii]
MSFTALLNQIKHKPSESPSKPSSQTRKPQQKSMADKKRGTKPAENTDELPNVPFKVDPAVQRLKELRRLEKEKEQVKEKLKKDEIKRKNAAKSASRSRASSSVSYRVPKQEIHAAASTDRDRKTRSVSPVKRLSFAELMDQARQKTISLKETKDPSPPSEHVPRTSRPLPKSASIPRSRSSMASGSSASRKTPSVPTNSRCEVKPKIVKPSVPKPLARPSKKLQEKLDAKRRARGEYQSSTRYNNDYEDEGEDDYMSDDFIVDDDEDDEPREDRRRRGSSHDPGYDRDEIWQMFGKNRRKYTDYDDDLSDMEATGEDIFDEEFRSEKRARMEEKAESERERRRIEEKRRRLGRR